MHQKEELSVTNEAMQQSGSPVGIGDIISKTFDEYTKNFSSYIILSIIVAIPSILLTILGTGQVDNGNFETGSEIGFGNLGAVAGLGLLLAVFSVIVTNAMIHTALFSKRGKAIPSTGEALSFGWSSFFRVLLVSIVVSLIVLAGLILLLIPGFIFGLWYMFSVVHTIDTSDGLNASLEASKKIGKGNYWTIIGIGVIYFVATFALSLLSIIPFLGQIISVALTPIASIGLVVMYLAFKGEKV